MNLLFLLGSRFVIGVLFAKGFYFFAVIFADFYQLLLIFSLLYLFGSRLGDVEDFLSRVFLLAGAEEERKTCGCNK